VDVVERPERRRQLAPALVDRENRPVSKPLAGDRIVCDHRVAPAVVATEIDYTGVHVAVVIGEGRLGDGQPRRVRRLADVERGEPSQLSCPLCRADDDEELLDGVELEVEYRRQGPAIELSGDLSSLGDDAGCRRVPNVDDREPVGRRDVDVSPSRPHDRFLATRDGHRPQGAERRVRRGSRRADRPTGRSGGQCPADRLDHRAASHPRRSAPRVGMVCGGAKSQADPDGFLTGADEPRPCSPQISRDGQR